MLAGNLRGAARGTFVGSAIGFDGGDGLKGVDLGLDGVVDVGGLSAASFCCGAEGLGRSSGEFCTAVTLLSWAFDCVPADPNNGEVPNENTGGADEAAG